MPILEASSHVHRIAITMNLSTLTSGRQGFNIGIFDKDETLNSQTYIEYTSVSSATTDEAAGYISPYALAAVTAAFAQTPRPAKVVVFPWDDAGGDAIADAIDDAIAAHGDFYIVCVSDRLPATNAAVAVKLASLASDGTKLLAVLQDDEADWLTSGVPSAYSGLTDAQNERIAVVYHDDDSDAEAERYAAKVMAWSPDNRSVPWTIPVTSGTALTTALTSTQRDAAKANSANLLLPFETSGRLYVDPGENLAGRPLDEVVTADWFEVRIREDIANYKGREEFAGRKVPATDQGVEAIKGIIDGRHANGVQAGHFNPDNQPTYTTATFDASARSITIEAGLVTLRGVLSVAFTGNLSATAPASVI